MKVNPQEVGQRIKSIRQNQGLSMSEFAAKIDSKARSGTVSNWETGKNLPNNTRLKKIASIGGVTINFLLYGDSDKTFSDIDGQYEPLKQLLYFFGLTKDAPQKSIDNKITQFLSGFFESEEGEHVDSPQIVYVPSKKTLSSTQDDPSGSSVHRIAINTSDAYKSILITNEDSNLLEKYRKLPEDKKKQLNDFLDFLSNQE